MVKDQEIKLSRGLRDVYIDTTNLSVVDGEAGELYYRGYNIHDLAGNVSFEEVVYLLLYEALPTREQLEQFDERIKAEHYLPGEITGILALIKDTHPVDVLRTAVSALGNFDPEESEISIEATLRKGVRLTAVAPTIVAAHARIRQGKKPVAPHRELGLAGNFLYMLSGEEPDPEDVKLIDKDFVLHAEHGANASAFGARVAASTHADLHCAITAGLAILKGPSHGGAAEAVMKMAQEIGCKENVESYIKARLESGKRIMGFGHRIYKVPDPRARHMRADAEALARRRGEPQWFDILEAVVDAMKPYGKKGIYPNVDFWSSIVYDLLGIPEDIFISIFSMGRIPGWTAHVVDQYRDNILIRPKLLYVGDRNLKFVPLEERG